MNRLRLSPAAADEMGERAGELDAMYVDLMSRRPSREYGIAILCELLDSLGLRRTVAMFERLRDNVEDAVDTVPSVVTR